MRRGKHRPYDFIVAAFMTVLLCSNLTSAAKAAEVDLPLVVIRIACLAQVGQAFR